MTGPERGWVRETHEEDFADLVRLDRAAFGETAYPPLVVRQFLEVHRESLLVADPDHLAEKGVEEVRLSVEPDNHAAVALYLDPRLKARAAG